MARVDPGTRDDNRSDFNALAKMSHDFAQSEAEGQSAKLINPKKSGELQVKLLYRLSGREVYLDLTSPAEMKAFFIALIFFHDGRWRAKMFVET